jgi:DNA-binding MarR family transcriptional regulator
MHRSNPDPTHRILEQVASGQPLSQRSLARDAGVALGLAHLLIHRMVQQGWVQMMPDGGNRVRYRITRAGLSERARRSRAHLASGIQYYVQARECIARRFAALSREGAVDGRPVNRIVFCGAGEAAEIGYVCVRRTHLRLVGVVDHCAGTPFFDLVVRGFDTLTQRHLDRVPFDVLVGMSFGDRKALRRALAAVGYPASSVFWI